MANIRDWLGNLPEPGKEHEFIVGMVKTRIRYNILDRVAELRACGERDSCAEFAELIESYIDEWLED